MNKLKTKDYRIRPTILSTHDFSRIPPAASPLPTFGTSSELSPRPVELNFWLGNAPALS